MTDRARIRAVLNRDRVWSVYALGDLEPGFFEHCEWIEHGDSLALLYRAFDTPVLFVTGNAGDWLADALGDESQVYLHVRPEAAAVLEARYDVTRKAMWRMTLDASAWRPAPIDGVTRLRSADVEDLERLYRDGDESGEAPDFYFRSMIDLGVFFGIRDGGELVSAAGTHLMSEAESVAGIGNVYTRRDRRGQGLAAQVTSAVVAELRGKSIETIALNVACENKTAARVYERLGFRRHCDYFEGVAKKRGRRS
jgi:ribosomal protein S18 acetylase RimI-like enzyme